MEVYARRTAFRWRLGLIAVLLLASHGCQRQSEVGFVAGDVVEPLSTSHQEQIRIQLRRFFGTPLHPRLAVPAEREAAEEDDPELVDFLDTDQLRRGSIVFERRCVGCHGTSGDGRGPAALYLQPKPRDYRRGIFKFTSTPYGAKPHRSDLIRVILRGAKGTSMPAFRWLSDDDLQSVVDYVIMLSYRGELERYVAQIVELDYDEGDEIEFFEFTDGIQRIHDSWQLANRQRVLPVTAEPEYSDESILAGRRAFLSRGCSKCHGDDGRGQTEWLSYEFLEEQATRAEGDRVQINYDVWEQVAPAADLTAGMLHGGRRPIDVYRRIFTGINGTPMPAFDQALADEPETLWHLVHYVLSLVERRDVAGMNEILPPASSTARVTNR